jgi:hypothetical protein
MQRSVSADTLTTCARTIDEFRLRSEIGPTNWQEPFEEGACRLRGRGREMRNGLSHVSANGIDQGKR